MASIRLQPPEPFTFTKPDEWLRWKKRFEQFRVASGLNNEAEERQVNTLLYCLGEEADDVLASTDISNDARRKYDDVINKFDSFFKVCKNVIFERARFNRRNQHEGETSEQYITVLYSLVESCEYGELRDEMIRDRFVVGIRDATLSQRLQLDSELTLEKAKREVRQKEAVQEQQLTLKGSSKSNPITLDALKAKWKHLPRRNRMSTGPTPSRIQKQILKQCTRCGRGEHSREKCPAINATCHKCKRRGHFSSQCFSKSSVSSVTTEESPQETYSDISLDGAYLDTITSGQQRAWKVKIRVGSQDTTFKIDTGAEVTAVSEEFFRKLKGKDLKEPSRLLYGSGRQPLDVLGQFTERLHYKQKSSLQKIFVVKGLRTNLLGLPAITSLDLAARVDTTIDYSSLVNESFPNVFQGLGNLGEPYEIQLKPDAKPWALYTPRTIPLPLRSKVQEELSKMESLGVISRVDQPTPWCAGMVAVPKKSGAIRICVDLKHLNEDVLREVHPLPKVDDTLAQLTGATVFSKLDANSGFWQIPLSHNSRLLTTFITPFGRFCFNKLPFGISSAPEHFQRRMNDILAEMEGVLCHMDDVLIFGSTAAEHDARLNEVLRRVEAAGATLNKEKCSFGLDRLKFLGHIIDKNGISADPEKVAAITQMKQPANVSELRRFMGMTNQQGKFSPRIAELTQPLRELLSKKNSWIWGPVQDSAFSAIKTELSKPTVLGLYDPEANTIISADASSYGLGAVLLQQNKQDTWKPIAYASRSMTETERRYAQIEKEALATTWACEKFTTYVLGKQIVIQTDHKPLVPLFSTKNLDNLPPRILRFRLRLNRFDFTIHHVPGKELYTADTLSRAPIAPPGEGSIAFHK